jgi:hypothetical protein
VRKLKTFTAETPQKLENAVNEWLSEHPGYEVGESHTSAAMAVSNKMGQEKIVTIYAMSIWYAIGPNLDAPFIQA